LPAQADAILIFEQPVPFMHPKDAPKASAKIAYVDPDPAQGRFKTMEFSSDLFLPVDPAGAALAIAEAAKGRLTQTAMGRIADRKARLAEKKRQQREDAEQRGLAAGKRAPLHPRWVAYQLGRALQPDTILLDDALSNTPYVVAHHQRSQPGTYFKSGGSTGGWGSGAAVGAKLAAPDRDVVLATGDGYFMFGEPLAGLWAAAHHKAPFLTVVFVNRSYSTGTSGLRELYPEGVAIQEGNYEGGEFDPPPDFAKLAEAAGGYGETVTDADQMGPALQRALDQVHKGYPAVIAAQIPTVIEEGKLTI
jgi:acetolactate synthase I/II/III large subunit